MKRLVSNVPAHNLHVWVSKAIWKHVQANAVQQGLTLRQYIEAALLEAIYRDKLMKKG